MQTRQWIAYSWSRLNHSLGAVELCGLALVLGALGGCGHEALHESPSNPAPPHASNREMPVSPTPSRTVARPASSTSPGERINTAGGTHVDVSPPGGGIHVDVPPGPGGSGTHVDIGGGQGVTVNPSNAAP